MLVNESSSTTFQAMGTMAVVDKCSSCCSLEVGLGLTKGSTSLVMGLGFMMGASCTRPGLLVMKG
jgi:hypothetical protein